MSDRIGVLEQVVAGLLSEILALKANNEELNTKYFNLREEFIRYQADIRRQELHDPRYRGPDPLGALGGSFGRHRF